MQHSQGYRRSRLIEIPITLRNCILPRSAMFETDCYEETVKFYFRFRVTFVMVLVFLFSKLVLSLLWHALQLKGKYFDIDTRVWPSRVPIAFASLHSTRETKCMHHYMTGIWYNTLPFRQCWEVCLGLLGSSPRGSTPAL